MTIRCNPFPMVINHLGKLLVGLQALPLQGSSPVLKEVPCPAFFLIVPQLAKGLFEQVSRLQPFIGLEQFLEGAAAVQGEVLPMRKQGILLAFNKLPVFAAQPGILVLPHLVQSLIEVTQDVEFVKQNPGLWSVLGLESRGAEGFPHIQDCQPNARALLGPQSRIEQIHTGFRPILPPKPDGPPAFQITDHDAVCMSLTDRNLVDPNDLGPRRSHPPQLLPHVLFVQLLDRAPVQVQLPSEILDSGGPAPASHKERKACGVKRLGGHPGHLLSLHCAAVPTPPAPQLDFQVPADISTGEAANRAYLVVVEGRVAPPASATGSFFPRRRRRITRALGSPKMPCTVALGRKPGKRYRSASRRRVRIYKS